MAGATSHTVGEDFRKLHASPNSNLCVGRTISDSSAHYFYYFLISCHHRHWYLLEYISRSKITDPTARLEQDLAQLRSIVASRHLQNMARAER
jgi:hypothetical protein